MDGVQLLTVCYSAVAQMQEHQFRLEVGGSSPSRATIRLYPSGKEPSVRSWEFAGSNPVRRST